MATVRSRVIVEGTVHGVFFRESTRRTAREFGVSGWVRNLPGRRVEAVFEGEPDAVEGMVAWTRVGPEHATVESLERFAEPPEGLVGFDVRD
ncbi:MAG TPA: acylphosphatase [Coriobacteriia bacterium]